jgi:hypothetical protein
MRSSMSFQAQVAHFRLCPIPEQYIAASHRSATNRLYTRRGVTHRRQHRQDAGVVAAEGLTPPKPDSRNASTLRREGTRTPEFQSVVYLLANFLVSPTPIRAH